MDLFDLVAKITLDTKDYEDKVKKSKNDAEGLGSKIGGAFKTLGKVTLAGLGAAAAGVASLTKSAVSAYADYEQLVGGIETLFEDLSWDVEQNANKAFQTAGLSANEYMETVMGFSAALNQSLQATEGNIARSADLADLAITDMADNANKMGSSMESIQNAYQGFAKQNYTMLDNLKLGYGGTKEEMERLLADAGKLANTKFDISSYADVIEAIHVIQTEMGITGTTAKEASQTISGSVASMKAAWQNLVAGVANDEADFGSLVSQFADSAATAAKNLLPRISQAVKGVGQLVSGLAPVVADALPKLVSDVLPGILSAASDMLSAFADGILESAPLLLNVALDAIMTLVEGLTDGGIDKIVDAAFKIIQTLADWLANNADKLAESAVILIVTLAEALLNPSNLGHMIESALMIVLKLAEGILRATGNLLSPAYELVGTIAKGIANKFGELVNKGREIVGKVGEGIKNVVSSAANWGKEMIGNFVQGMIDGWNNLKQKALNVWNAIAHPGKHSIPKDGPFKRDDLWGEHMIENFMSGMQKKAPALIDAANNTAESVASAFQFGGGYSYGSNTSRASDGGFVDELRALREEVRNMKIYLDTGVLVGAVNKGMGNQYGIDTRRVLA